MTNCSYSHKFYACLSAFLELGLRGFSTHGRDLGQPVQGKSLGSNVRRKLSMQPDAPLQTEPSPA